MASSGNYSGKGMMEALGKLAVSLLGAIASATLIASILVVMGFVFHCFYFMFKLGWNLI